MDISENVGLLELLLLAGIALSVVGLGKLSDFKKELVRSDDETRPYRNRNHEQYFRAAGLTQDQLRILRQVVKYSLLLSTAFTAAYLLVVGL